MIWRVALWRPYPLHPFTRCFLCTCGRFIVSLPRGRREMEWVSQSNVYKRTDGPREKRKGKEAKHMTGAGGLCTA